MHVLQPTYWCGRAHPLPPPAAPPGFSLGCPAARTPVAVSRSPPTQPRSAPAQSAPQVLRAPPRQVRCAGRPPHRRRDAVPRAGQVPAKAGVPSGGGLARQGDGPAGVRRGVAGGGQSDARCEGRRGPLGAAGCCAEGVREGGVISERAGVGVCGACRDDAGSQRRGCDPGIPHAHLARGDLRPQARKHRRTCFRSKQPGIVPAAARVSMALEERRGASSPLRLASLQCAWQLPGRWLCRRCACACRRARAAQGVCFPQALPTGSGGARIVPAEHRAAQPGRPAQGGHAPGAWSAEPAASTSLGSAPHSHTTGARVPSATQSPP